MAKGCKITKSLNGKNCDYSVAGISILYLANWYPPVEGEAAVAGAIAYKKDTDGYIESITLPTGEKFYEIKGEDGTISISDTLQLGGNGGKYRQHTVNATLGQNDVDVLDEGDALSLGKFIAISVDKAGQIRLLGRTGGLSAPAGGFDYNSGAAEADATGWTLIQQGTSIEIAPTLKNISVVTPIYEEAVVIP